MGGAVMLDGGEGKGGGGVGEHAERMTDERSFLTNECQTLEGVDHSRNGQSKAHSFCFGRKLKPTGAA